VFRILSECKGDESKLQTWLKRIPRADLKEKLSGQTVVCIKHFVPQFIITHDSATRPDGSVLTVRRDKPKLARDAYPSLFENSVCPSYLSFEPPAKRRNPDDRRSDAEQRDNAAFVAWLQNDKITDYEHFIQGAAEHCAGPWKTVSFDDRVVFYVLHVVNDVLSVRTSLSVMQDLSLCVSICGNKIEAKKFSWVLGGDGKLDCWSKLTTLLSHLLSTDSTAAVSKDMSEKVAEAINILTGIYSDDDDVEVSIDDKEDEAKFQRVVKFCLQQLRLLLMKQIRYSADFLRWAFQTFSLSPSNYLFLRESCLVLPHPTYLRILSSCLSVEPGTDCNEHIAYLTEKAKLLPERERYAILMLDEIYVKPKVSYKAGTVEGFAENCDMSQATTVQAFMIMFYLSSLLQLAVFLFHNFAVIV
jgi:hypothetical protein